MSITEKISIAIQNANQILAITHIGPDGDAFGSLTAVGVALAQLGKNVTLVCDDHMPRRFQFLPLTDRVQRAPNSDATYDLVISVDCGDEMRMGQAYANLPDPKPFLINIDHHITNTRFGQINLVGEKAVSTTEALYDLFTEMGLTFTQDMAICLLTGLVTDTLSFSTIGVNAKTLKIAGSLVAAGADLSRITMQALKVKPISALHLWRAGLGNAKVEGGLIWTAISNAERKQSGHMGSSTAGLVNFLADIQQAAMSAVLIEMGDGAIRVGFRCRPPYSVSEIALNLGGGGHALAAGCTLSGPLPKAEKLVVAMSKEAIRQQEAIFQNGPESD